MRKSKPKIRHLAIMTLDPERLAKSSRPSR
jgi:hypothetical protein